MTCVDTRQRWMRQIDPLTGEEAKGVVHDVQMVIATVGGDPGKGKGHPDNLKSGAFIGTHGAALTLTACSQLFTIGKDYVIEIADAPQAEAPTEAKPSPTS